MKAKGEELLKNKYLVRSTRDPAGDERLWTKSFQHEGLSKKPQWMAQSEEGGNETFSRSAIVKGKQKKRMVF